MRFNTQIMLLSSVGLFASTVLAVSQTLNEVIHGLNRDLSGDAWIQLSADHKSVQAVNANGDVIDQVPITPLEEAKIRDEIALASIATKREEATPNQLQGGNALEKRGCPSARLPCQNDKICQAEGCEGCFHMNPSGICYGYSK